MTLPQLHPEVASLQNDCRLLTEELANLLASRDELENTIIPNIKADYQLAVGGLELELFSLKIEVSRLSRTIGLAQAAINRGKAPDWTDIETQLTVEFAQWQAEMDQKAADLSQAKDRAESLLSPEDSRKVKDLYHRLVKRLHPDLNPDQAKSDQMVWNQAAEAYQRGDLIELEALWLVVQADGQPTEQPSSLDLLVAEKDRLLDLIAKLMAAIDELKAGPAYSLLVKLNDPDWLEQQRSVLIDQINQTNRKRKELRLAANLLKAGPAGQSKWHFH